MFRQYRQLQKDEFIIVGGDCSQGGADSNVAQFYSVTLQDVPLIYHSKGVAATMTTTIYPVLERIADFTGIKPLVGFERNMGGASEMERLAVLNRLGKYVLYTMPKIGSTVSDTTTTHYGFDTTSLSRPMLLGGLKEIIDVKGIIIYDKKTIEEMSLFIVNRQGKPEAAKGAHDDTVIALAVALFMQRNAIPNRIQFYTPPSNDIAKKKWSIGK